MAPKEIYPHGVRVGLGVMKMKEYSTLPIFPSMEVKISRGFFVFSFFFGYLKTVK